MRTAGVVVEGMAGSQPALFHRCRRQAGEADDIAHRVYVRDFGLEIIIDRNTPAAIRCDTRIFQSQLVSTTNPAGGKQHHVGTDTLATFQFGDYLAMRATGDSGNLF